MKKKFNEEEEEKPTVKSGELSESEENKTDDD